MRNLLLGALFVAFGAAPLGAMAAPAEYETLANARQAQPRERAGRALTERSIETRLMRQGYEVEHIDRRGEAFYVRVTRGYDIYAGYVGADDGRWLHRVRTGYHNGGRYWNRGGDPGPRFSRWERRDRERANTPDRIKRERVMSRDRI